MTFEEGELVVVRFPSGREVTGRVLVRFPWGRYDVATRPRGVVHCYPRSWIRSAA